MSARAVKMESTPRSGEEKVTLRLLSYNILLGGQDRMPGIRNVIREQRPDVVALLEANDRGHVETLARELDMELAFGQAANGSHVVFLSRLPIRRAENHPKPMLAKTLLEIEVEGSPLHLLATHLEHTQEERRAEEVSVILEMLRQLRGQPHLLAGDFNAIRPGDPIGPHQPGHQEEKAAQVAAPQAVPLILEAGYVDCYRALHPAEPGFTYQTDTPFLRIDFVFASPEMADRLQACDVVTEGAASAASDHYPIYAEFE